MDPVEIDFNNPFDDEDPFPIDESIVAGAKRLTEAMKATADVALDEILAIVGITPEFPLTLQDAVNFANLAIEAFQERAEARGLVG